MEKKEVYDNRELSWLKFNQRVLEEAEDLKNPLCERFSFLSIFQSNLDEFIMVRVGALTAGQKSDIRENKTNLTCTEQLDLISKKEMELLHYKDKVYQKLMNALVKFGVAELHFKDLSEKEKRFIESYFENNIRPFISPQIVGKRLPFPFLRNKEIYAVIELQTKSGSSKIGIIPCSSPVIKRMIPVSDDGKRFMLAEEVILHFAAEIFDRYTVSSKSLIRILRSAEIDVDEVLSDDEHDYRKAMEDILKTRNRLSPLRIAFSRTMKDSIIGKTCGFLGLSKQQVFQSKAPLDLSFLFKVEDLLRSDRTLFYKRRVPQQSFMVNRTESIMEQVRKKDILLSYPYESMRPFIRLLNEAAIRPEVVSIKMTLYRLANNSKIVEALAEAAENGKEVVVLVELRARFDEENNIKWSRQLEEAGCRVIYGLNRLKVHSKLCLITQKRNEKIEYITQAGTGNYNEKTATLYTDYSLITSSFELGKEAANVFDCLAMGKTVEQTTHLLVAPNCLQNKVLNYIDKEIEKAEAGKEAYIGIKINSLTDKKIIDRLIQASKAGVQIQMAVRGICCLNAKVENETDNIEIISIVGRFLEHSRIYIFGKGEEAKLYLSSADYMTRNTIKRVEVAIPVYDKEIKKRLLEDFNIYFSDDVKARMQENGIYVRKETKTGLNAQEYLYEQAYRHTITDEGEAETAKENI